MVPTTRFTDPAAVDAWDHWFRWRNGDGLRDRTIDATWWRVADSLAAVEGPQAATWAFRYVDAFSRWQLLPDERLLRMAGTEAGLSAFESPSAVLNVSAFVTAPLTPHARFDGGRFAAVAALAVRMLDDALVTMHGTAAAFAGLRIGVVGLGDALQSLGIGYDDPRAADHACRVGTALANGTLRGTSELAQERGPIDPRPVHQASLWHERGALEPLIEQVMRDGVRHSRLTAIELQPRLALLANNASDALDPPLPRHGQAGGETTMTAPPSSLTPEAMITAQLALRAAIQPWIDAPIEYPLATVDEPDPQTLESYVRLAGAYGLCEPRFVPLRLRNLHSTELHPSEDQPR